jgi:CRISPR system Cascade subunit CasD
MTTVLLRLEGPLQSWGIGSRYDIRTTRPEPTKSGVVGLVAAALGRSREDDVSDLAEMRFGVRSDRPGETVRDYHTALGIVNAQANKRDRSVISQRYYLADACFLAGLEGERALAEKIHTALERPAVVLALGRRSCPPSAPIHVPGGLMEDTLDRLLRAWPLLAAKPDGAQEPEERRVRVAVECELESADYVQRDQPVARAFRDRIFHPRGARIEHVEHPPPVPLES